MKIKSTFLQGLAAGSFGVPESCGTWNWEEITAICKVVGIPQEQIGEYFFPEVK